MKAMNITTDISSDKIATVSVEIPVEEVSGEFTSALEEFRRSASVPGFRPGKIPMNLIRKRYGRFVMEEKAEQLVRDYLPDALKEMDLKPGGRIILNLVSYGEDTPLKFEASFPLNPEVKLSVYRGLRVLVNKPELTEEDVDNQIEALRRKHAVLRSIDTPAPAEAKLELTVQEIDPSGLPLINRPKRKVEFEFGADQLGVGTDEQLIGIRTGETRTIRALSTLEIFDRVPQPRVIVTDSNFRNGDDSARERFLAVKAEKVEIPELPPLDDEFAQMVNPRLKGVKDLREWTRFNLLAFIGSRIQAQIERGVIMRLIEENPFDIPPAVLESTLAEVAERSDITGDEQRKFIAEHRREAEFDLRWVMLRDAVAEAENITIDDDELEAQFERIAKNTGQTIEQVRNRYSNRDARDRLRDHLLERRVIKFLTKHAVLEKREMSVDEFLSEAIQE